MKEDKLRAKGERKHHREKDRSREVREGKLCLAEDSKGNFDIATQRGRVLRGLFCV